MKSKLFSFILLSFIFSPWFIKQILAQTPYSVNIKAWLEGPFNGIQMNTDLYLSGYIPSSQPFNEPPFNYSGTEYNAAIPPNVVDWVLVELRETAGDVSTAYEDKIVARQAGFILDNGTVVAADGMNSLQFNNTISYKLYLVLYHRNHLAVISANELVFNAGDYSYDFTTGSGQAYEGSLAQKELAQGAWGLIACDGDSNGQVNNADKNYIWSPQSGSSGYMEGDFNLNGDVTTIDKTNYWSKNGGKSSRLPGPWHCGLSVVLVHSAGNVAPVNKTVNYGTVESNLTGSNKCWITQNLGSDQQATSPSDATEISAGWYWQFNRKQGFKHDGTIRTPSWGWVTGLINENSAWQITNEPCALLMGNGWRMPTDSEWSNADVNGGWNSYFQTYACELKLHAAGSLGGATGSLNLRGYEGYQWSSSQYNNTIGWCIYFNNFSSYMFNFGKYHGDSIRCLRDE